jgi:hypothetical protein
MIISGTDRDDGVAEVLGQVGQVGVAFGRDPALPAAPAVRQPRQDRLWGGAAKGFEWRLVGVGSL